MDEPPPLPTFGLEGRTYIWDVKRKRQVAYINGLIPLPVNACIELDRLGGQKHKNGIVQRIRLAGGSSDPRHPAPMALFLDVVLEDPQQPFPSR